jgi:hypothetical protein
MSTSALGAIAAFVVMGVANAQTNQVSTCANCGVVVSIVRVVEEEAWTPLGTSSAASTTTGGDVQARSAFAFGGAGKPSLVLVGAAGGAVYAKRPNSYQRPRWDVTVKLDAGATRVLPQLYEPLLREGDRVRVFGTQVELAR